MKPLEKIKNRISQDFTDVLQSLRARRIMNAFSRVVREDKLESYLFDQAVAPFNNQTPMAYGTADDQQCQSVVAAAAAIGAGEPS